MQNAAGETKHICKVCPLSMNDKLFPTDRTIFFCQIHNANKHYFKTGKDQAFLAHHDEFRHQQMTKITPKKQFFSLLMCETSFQKIRWSIRSTVTWTSFIWHHHTRMSFPNSRVLSYYTSIPQNLHVMNFQLYKIPLTCLHGSCLVIHHRRMIARIC